MIAFIKDFFEKNQQTTKGVRGDEKILLLGYQSIQDKYEPAHEIFILIAKTQSHPLYMHAQLSSGLRSVNFG